MKQLTVIGLLISSVWAAAFALIVFLNMESAMKLGLNEWGDFLAGFSAPLALFWLVIGYFQQGKELRLNTEALKAQHLELNRQVKETSILAGNAERQARAAESMTLLTEKEQMRLETKEIEDAQPMFRSAGGGSTSGVVHHTLVNKRSGRVRRRNFFSW